MCFAPQRRALFEYQLPKVVRACNVFGILNLRCTSPHNSVHFFNISTWKSAPKMVRFYHFDCEICFSPQRRALFDNFLNFQKCSGPNPPCFWHFDFHICFRHKGVHFLKVWTAKSALTMRCFVHFDIERCFAPQWRAILHLSSPQMAPHPPNLRSSKTLEKQCFATFLPGSSFFCLSLLWSSFFCMSFLWLFPPLLFHLSILSEVWLLNFIRTYGITQLIRMKRKKTLETSGISKSHAKKGNLRTQETLHDGQLELQQPAYKSSSHCEISTFVAPVVSLFVSTILVQVRYPSRNKMSSRADSKCDRSNASPWQSR